MRVVPLARQLLGRRPLTPARMLQRGDAVPHAEVRTIEGALFRYATIWQRRNLLLVVLPASAAGDTYAAEVSSRGGEFRDLATECVITRDSVPGLAGPAVLVADRWGEIVHVAATARVAELPAPEALLEWLDYLERRCPECEGEAR